MTRDVHGRAPAGEAPLRLLIADDHPAIVDAVTRYVADEDGLEVVGTAGGGEEALRLIEQRRPDVAILDLKMGDVGGIDVLRRLQEPRELPPPAVILYTAHAERGLLLEALDVGARAFLLKESPLSELMRAVRVVGSGGTFIDPVLAGVVAGSYATDRLPALTARQREILRLLADGLRNEEIAARLAISPLTVKTHVKQAMERLEADTRTQAVASALRLSLIR